MYILSWSFFGLTHLCDKQKYLIVLTCSARQSTNQFHSSKACFLCFSISNPKTFGDITTLGCSCSYYLLSWAPVLTVRSFTNDWNRCKWWLMLYHGCHSGLYSVNISAAAPQLIVFLTLEDIRRRKIDDPWSAAVDEQYSINFITFLSWLCFFWQTIKEKKKKIYWKRT